MFNLDDAHMAFLRKHDIVDGEVTQENVEDVLDELALLISAEIDPDEADDIITVITTSVDW